MKAYTQEDVIAMMRKAIGKGTAKDYAEQLGVSQQYLSDVLRGRRQPGPTILERLGLTQGYFAKRSYK